VLDGSGERVRLAVTLGDVRGIGPEIIAKAAAASEVRATADLVFVGPSGAGVSVDERTGIWDPGDNAATAGRFAGRAIERAVVLAAERVVDGIVTAPLDKAALFAGGYSYPGHTEMLATLTGRKVAMMLAATKPGAGATHPLRVVLDRALATLPERQRSAFLLREVEDLSFREVAEALGVNEATARVHHLRARRALRELLKDEPGAEAFVSEPSPEEGP